MPHGELSIHELVAHCDGLLDIHATRDFGPNGLQVEGRRPVRSIVTGVSACLELFERAGKAGADAVLVHHGLFWDGQPRQLVGWQARRVAALVESGMHLVAYHLPLDRHAELGNNVLAAKGLGLYSIEPFAEYHGSPIGFRGRYPEPVAAAESAEAGWRRDAGWNWRRGKSIVPSVPAGRSRRGGSPAGRSGPVRSRSEFEDGRSAASC